eukprot:14669963-Alexandrium_andersonii.AAC.1
MPERTVDCWHIWQLDKDMSWRRHFRHAPLGKLHPTAKKKLAEMRAMDDKRIAFTKSRDYWDFVIWGGPGSHRA